MKKFIVNSLLTVMTIVPSIIFAEDIELYVSSAAKLANANAQILIIFDTSGSMDTVETVNVGYDPLILYPAVANDNSLNESFTYYTKGSSDGGSLPVPDKNNESIRFLSEINSCETARILLETNGFYVGHLREYVVKGQNGTWEEIPDNNGANIEVIDCEDDVLNNDSTNIATLPAGFPVDSEGSKQNPVYHTPLATDSLVNWSGESITLYSDNYLRWYHQANAATELKSRIDVARESITSVISSAPSMSFGLQVFNANDGDINNSGNGGRIVFGIKKMNTTNNATLVNIIDNQLEAGGNTPLCETLYEAQQYFAGKNVDYGDDDINKATWNPPHNKNVPPRDLTIESGAKYITPFTSCSNKAYVIYITDGVPTRDNHADTRVTALSALENGVINNFNGSKYEDNYLPALAGWMNDHDINANISDKQTVSTYTIGFSSGATAAKGLLTETAKLGGGKYFEALDAAQLTAALINTLADLGESNASLTSASVAANNFDRTETLNSVYYAMFQPKNSPRWQGNLKKYKLVDKTQVGVGDIPAITGDGLFSPDVTSFWSSTIDGDKVVEGGVAEMLRNKSNRTFYTDSGTNLVTLDDPYVLANTTALATDLGVISTEVKAHIDWAKGIDVDDDDNDSDIADIRVDVFGDPLHSKPLVINYGTSIRIMIGTNAGVLHMFEDNDTSVDETWAFMPKEFLSNIKALRDNTSSQKIYGIDGQITKYLKDFNSDGVINGTDKAWIFFGLRRGGTSYYAVDVSTPASPTLMWHIDSSTPGFSELGQSWSQPKVGFSKINMVGGVAKPVLFFGGGYDTSKDSTSLGTDDNIGRAIYMVDAETGALKWSLAPIGGTTTFSGTDSIPSSIGILDSDGDGMTDRLYAGDTGGNVWRVDMPDSNTTDWSIYKLAELGNEAGNTDLTNDRRFFSEPSIVRTFITETIETTYTDINNVQQTQIEQQELPYDAILIGSGDRSNPLGTDTQDMLFMIKDENIRTQTFPGVSPITVTPAPILFGDLFDFTNDRFEEIKNLAEAAQEAARETLSLAVSLKSGWYVNLEESGEKSSSSPLAINGTAFYTSFTPPSLVVNPNACTVPSGKGWLYALDLALGTKIYNWAAESSDNRTDRIAYINEQFLGSPTLIVTPTTDGNGATTTTGEIIVGRKVIPVGFQLQTLRTSLSVTETP